jgi:hypothetical protein
MQPVPLRLFLLAHPRSSSASLLAQELMRRFVDPPATGGLRLPVHFTPDRGDGLPPQWDSPEGLRLDDALHTLVVVLVDVRMAQRVSFQGEHGTGRQWQQFLSEGAARAPVGKSPHHVFAVAIAKARDPKDRDEDSCFALGESRHMLPVKKEPGPRRPGEALTAYGERIADWLGPAADEIALHITIRAIRLLDGGRLPVDVSPEQKAPVRLFLSHAKADLDSNEADVVRQVEAAIKELPIEPWFDAAKIRPGAEFEHEITSGLLDSSIMIAFLTDHYGSRPWCQREVLDAKRLGAPILVVSALSTGEPRNFPYLGNLPTIAWPGPGPDPALHARRIVGRAVREALRFKHNRALLQRWARPGETIVASAPEAVSLAWRASADSEETLLYPDPPLTRQELAVLRVLRPRARFLTPLSKIAQWKRPSSVQCLAVSTSISSDKERLGLSRDHEEAIFDEVHGYLLLAGLQIAYGGALKGGFAHGTNFTHRLFELVRAYSRLAEAAGAESIKPILNVAPWPLRLAYGPEEAALFGTVADLVEGERPPSQEIPEADETLFPMGSNLHALPETPERRLAWARGLTAMRIQVTRCCQARLVIGGTLSGFKGIYPGVLEEAWMSVVSRQPLFLVGGFGGAAAAVIDVLLGKDRPELTSPCLASTVPGFHEVSARAVERGLVRVEPGSSSEVAPPNLAGKWVTPERILQDLREAGQAGLSTALQNRLSEDENLELARSLDAPRIAELVLTGLSRMG